MYIVWYYAIDSTIYFSKISTKTHNKLKVNRLILNIFLVKFLFSVKKAVF